MKWLKKVRDKLADKALDRAIDLSFAVLASTAVYYGRDWLFVSQAIWPAVPIGLGLVIVALAVVLYRKRTPKRFKPLRVHEDSMNVFWSIKKAPIEWVNIELNGYDDLYIHDLVDGPFCAAKRDDRTLCLGSFASPSQHGAMRPLCDGCRRDVFADALGLGLTSGSDDVDFASARLKRNVLRMIQREVRSSRKRLRKDETFRLLRIDPEQGPRKVRYR